MDTPAAREIVTQFRVISAAGDLGDVEVLWPDKEGALEGIEGNLEPLGGRPSNYVLSRQTESENKI